MRKMRQLGACVLAAAMTLGLTACGGSGTQTAATQAAKEETKAAAAESTDAAQAEEPGFTYPMASGDTITYWGDLNTAVSAHYSNMDETPFGQAWQEYTGIDIEFLHPPIGQGKEQFSLIVADGELPDIMEFNWLLDYPGGPEKAIKDGVIIPLNDVFEQYCPNITAYLAEHPEVDKMIKTDEGHYYVFPFLRGDPALCSNMGFMLRKDWLDDLNLEVPTTMDEWEAVLTEFKNEKGAQAPLCMNIGMGGGKTGEADPLACAFGTNKSFYLGSDGTVHFGAVEPSYKEYLTMMARWYAEGLIDPDCATLKTDQLNAKMSNGTGGSSFGTAGNNMGTWLTAAKATNPDYDLVAAPWPTLEKGDYPEFGQYDNPYSGKACAAITTSCKDVERAARLLDYAYGEEGHMLFNFGVEGESYTMVDGYPTFTDLVLNHPEGWPVAQIMSAYTRAAYNGPFVQDIRYLPQYYTTDAQKGAPEAWGATNGSKHSLPPITATTDESKELATIMNEINTYRDEMILKFIFGHVSLDEFDAYVSNIENMGLARALEIQNAALERYNSR